MIEPRSIGHRIAPPRFLLFALATLIAVPLAAMGLGWRQGVMAGFDIGAILFFATSLPLLGTTDQAQIRSRARANDANRPELLALTGVVTVVVLVAVAAEVTQRGTPAKAVVALIVGTLVISWLFSTLVYALHYAHLFYSEEGAVDRGGLDFPGTPDPDYTDFLYFAATLGMTFQTSDVEINDRTIRRVVTVHSLMAFVFNIGVLAFTINVLGGG
jgi:uncharacterized membrane protein